MKVGIGDNLGMMEEAECRCLDGEDNVSRRLREGSGLMDEKGEGFDVNTRRELKYFKEISEDLKQVW